MSVDFTLKFCNSKKVILGMSGGVDSSVSAWLLLQKGYKVEGLFMKNWEEEYEEFCSVKKDLNDAEEVCNKLGIKLHKINFSAEYWDSVFKQFLEDYREGRTPNPDILCNKEIKFKLFLEFAKEELHADYIAMGHYVRRKDVNDEVYLLRGIDENKDQSYFLYALDQYQISHSLFPLGEFKKSEVRRIAKSLNFVTANKKDSTGICFIGKRKFRDFLSQYLPIQTGLIETIDGEVIGEHQGLQYYTIGQRQGLGIGGFKKGNNHPWYVADKDVLRNCLVVVQGRFHNSLMSMGLIARKLQWIGSKSISNFFNVTVKTRYRQKDVSCKVLPFSSDSVKVYFSAPIFAVAPGQSVVFYSEDVCLGGGVIEKSFS